MSVMTAKGLRCRVTYFAGTVTVIRLSPAAWTTRTIPLANIAQVDFALPGLLRPGRLSLGLVQSAAGHEVEVIRFPRSDRPAVEALAFALHASIPFSAPRQAS